MSTTIGRVDFIVGLDGNTLPTQAREIGERIGRALGQAAARRANFEMGRAIGSDSSFDDAGKALGRRLANSLGEAFTKDLVPSLQRTSAVFQKALPMGKTLEDIGELRVVSREAAEGMDDLGDSTDRSTRAWGRFRNVFSRVGDSIRNTRDHIRSAHQDGDRLVPTLTRIATRVRNIFSFDGSRFVSMLGSINDHWKDMTHGVRQAVFYVALFATLATQIAVLGSAAGVALTVLAGAIVAVGLAAGAAILLFQGLDGEISELDPAIQPAVTAFRAIGDAFGAMQAQIQASVLPALIPTFEALKGLVEAITPGMVILAGAVGNVIAQLVNMLTSANGLAVLNGLIAGAAPIFQLLGSALLNLGGALGNIFLIAQPYILQFSAWLNTIFTQFNEWTQSVAGNTAITEWLQNGFLVLGKLGDLIVQVADFMNQLVTPATIASLLEFVQIIGGALQPLGQFLLALNEFKIFNIIAQLISSVFTELAPLMPAFSLLGMIISNLIIRALQIVTPLVTTLTTAFAALIDPLVGALVPLLPQLSTLLSNLAAMLLPVLNAVVLLAGVIGQALAPVLSAVINFVLALIQAFMPLIEAIIPPLTEVISVLSGVLSQVLAAILPIIIQLLDEVLAAILPIIPTIVELIVQFLTLIDPLLELLGPILPPLIELLKFLITVSIIPLTAAIKFLVPVILGVVTALNDLFMPAIAAMKTLLGGLIEFLGGVFTGSWNRIWSGLGQIVRGIWDGLIGFIKGAVNAMVSVINGLIGGVNAVTGAVGIPAIPKIPRLARGGIAWQSMIANIGEDGPEMVVPLRRPLSMIPDPRVRDVAAYAQGKTTGDGSGTVNNFAEGAIQVNEVGDARKTAIEVVDRFVEVAG